MKLYFIHGEYVLNYGRILSRLLVYIASLCSKVSLSPIFSVQPQFVATVCSHNIPCAASLCNNVSVPTTCNVYSLVQPHFSIFNNVSGSAIYSLSSFTLQQCVCVQPHFVATCNTSSLILEQRVCTYNIQYIQGVPEGMCQTSGGCSLC